MKKQFVLDLWTDKIMLNRKAFTLIEVLISIALLGMMLPVLFSAVDALRDSNQHLLKYLKKSKEITSATKILYMDILSSDGNISMVKDEFTRLCMEETSHSLYALSRAKVCWLVLKEKNTLVRIEGNDYHLPLKSEERVEVDYVMNNMELFDVYRQKKEGKVLVFLQQKDKEAISFMIQGIAEKKKKKKKIPSKKELSPTEIDNVP